ncbi:1,4-alpha-glucan branching protein [Streptomyces sp. NPDC005899]|uniref:maltokinase N-terminal cap-like domain-containing protein n=1 Tax=Streptomyces sp. NPDC005899 TaxID=3155716 RepID=UPI00340ABC7F
MAVIHRTTMDPGKLQLIAAWLPTRPWYTGTGEPELDRTGGFRLDDPQGEVGIEFMVATDTSGQRPVTYLVPLTYRGAPLAGADDALLGTSEHGVLGRRWVYDGVHDPVLVAGLLALVRGSAEPQAQSESDTPDPTVTVVAADGGPDAVTSATVREGKDRTRIVLNEGADAATLVVSRVLEAEEPAAAVRGHVSAPWRLPDGGEARGRILVLADGVAQP